MVDERPSYTETLHEVKVQQALLRQQMDAVIKRLDQPMDCVQGALVALQLQHVREALKDLGAVREEDYRTLTAHERRLQSLEERAQVKVAKIAAIAALVGTVVTGAIQLIMTLA